jgi:hypothetical protein
VSDETTRSGSQQEYAIEGGTRACFEGEASRGDGVVWLSGYGEGLSSSEDAEDRKLAVSISEQIVEKLCDLGRDKSKDIER